LKQLKHNNNHRQNCVTTKTILLERNVLPCENPQDVKLVIMVNEDGFLLMPSWNPWLSIVEGHLKHLLDWSERIDNQAVERLEMMKEKLDAQFDYTPCALDFKHMRTMASRILKT